MKAGIGNIFRGIAGLLLAILGVIITTIVMLIGTLMSSSEKEEKEMMKNEGRAKNLDQYLRQIV